MSNLRKIAIYDKNGSMYSIDVAPNQKIVRIHREKNSINFKNNRAAMQALSPKTYMLYMYLITLPNGRMWALSRKAVFEATTLTERGYEDGVHELIEKGYLVLNEKEYSNCYDFWEDPSLNAIE